MIITAKKGARLVKEGKAIEEGTTKANDREYMVLTVYATKKAPGYTAHYEI